MRSLFLCVGLAGCLLVGSRALPPKLCPLSEAWQGGGRTLGGEGEAHRLSVHQQRL